MYITPVTWLSWSSESRTERNLRFCQMPTVAIDKADLWERLGKEYSQLPSLFSFIFSLNAPWKLATEEFDKLCFDYGLELDEDVCILNWIQSFLGLNISQTTAEVEEAIKKGLPAERPVNNIFISRPSILNAYGLLAIENRDSRKQVKCFLDQSHTGSEVLSMQDMIYSVSKASLVPWIYSSKE